MTDRISLLHLVNEFAYSSTNYRIYNLLNGLDRDRYDVHIGCITPAGGPMENEYAALNIQVTNFALPADSPGWNLRLLSRIARYSRQHRIQILHTHALRADVFGGISVRFRKKRPALIATKGNAWYTPSQRGWMFRNLLYWPAMYLPDVVVTVSKTLRRDLLSRLWIKPRHIVSVHTGIRLDEFSEVACRDSVRADLGIPANASLLIYTGRLVTGKGLDDLLHAFQSVSSSRPDTYLLLAGAGPLLEPLQKLASKLDISERTVFSGFRNDVARLLSVSDLFVQPSLTEGLSQSIIEAMASGLCVVATHVGGTPELVENGVTGILVAPSDRAQLTDALSVALDNRQRREEFGQRGKEFVHNSFTIQNMVDEYDRLYQWLSED